MSEIYKKLREVQAACEAAERDRARSAASSPAAPPTFTPAPASTSAAAPSMAASLTQMVERTLAVARFRQELDDRVSSAGIAGVEAVLALSDRLRSGLDRVPPGEIEQAEAQLSRLREGLANFRDELHRLKMLKVDLAAGR